MLHLKFKPQNLPQIVALKHIKTHQTGELPHFVTFLNVFPLLDYYQKVFRVQLGSSWGPVRCDWGLVGVQLVLVGVWLGTSWVRSGFDWGPIEVRSGSN